MKTLALGLLGLCSTCYAFDYTTFEFNAGSGLQGEIDIQQGAQGLITASEVGSYDFTSLSVWEGGQDFTAIGTGAICPPEGCGLDVIGQDLYWLGGRINFTTLPQASPPFSTAVSYSGDTNTEAREYLAPSVGTLIGTDPMNAPEIDPSGTLPALTLLLGGLAVLRGTRSRRTDY